MPFNPATAKPINAAPAGSQPAAPRKFNPATARPLPKASDLRPTDEGTGWIGATAASIAGNLPLPRQVRDTLIAAPSAVVRGVGRAVQGIEEAAADTLTYGPDAQLATLGPLGGAIASTAAGARALGFGPANPVKAPGIGAAVVQGTQQVDRFGTSLQRQAAAETSGFGVEGDLLSPSTWRARPGATAEGVAANAVSTFGEMVPIMAIGRGAGAGAAMTTAAGQSYAGNREEQARRIMEMPPEQVATLPGFRDLVEAGLAPEQAHQALAELAGATAGATAAPFAALSGLILGGPISDPIKRFLVGRLGVNRAAEIAARLGAGAVPPVLEGLQEAGEGVLARAGANQATGQQGGLTEGSLENFVGGAFGGLAGSVGDAGVPVESARARRAREDDEAAIDESAADAALRTADPGLVDIINGQQRAGALPAPPDATAWRVDPRGNVQVPGTNPPLLTARAGVGADFVVGPSGVATPGPTTEIAQPAPAPGGLREVDRSVRGPSAGLAPAQIPEPGPQARIDPATGALVGVPQGRELVPFGAVPPAPVEPNRSTPPTSNTPQPAPDDPDADLNDPKMQRLMALDPENPANAAEFGLPPAPKRSGSAWAFPSPREISARIKATPKATKQSVTRSLFNPRYHDALDFLTLEGGLDRTAWMGAKGKRGEGVDPAVLRAKGNDATNRRFAGVGAPSLFPSSGGLTPSEARERLQGAGFLQADPESGVATSDDRDAVELVMESLNQGRRFYSSNPDAQDFRAALGEVKRRQLDFAQRQEQRKAEDAEAAVLGTDREGLRRLVREMESRGEVQQAVTFDDANDGATIAEWAIRADNAGVPEADVMNALAGEGFIPRADIARQLAELIREKGNAAERSEPTGNRTDGRRRVSRAEEGEGRRSDAAGDAGARRGEGRRAEPAAQAAAEPDETATLRQQVERLTAELRTSKLGIPNRRAFDEDESLGWPAVGAADMDGLKRLNDWLGHEAGDAVLRVVANQMSGAATDGLRFYHLSGDEFAARARDPAALAEAMAALQRELDRHPVLLRNADGDELLYDGVGLTFGTGVSYDEADQAANQSKRDRLASGAREEARGDGPPRRLRKADSARVPRGDDGSPQPDREGAGARRVPVTPEPAPPAPAPEPPQNPAPAGFSLSAPQKPAEPAPRFSAQPDLLAPPTAADALRTQQQRTTDRLRFGGAEGAGARGDLFGGVERNQQADLAGGDGAALGTEPVPVPPRETTSPAGPVTPEPAAPAAAPARRSLALIQLEVETTDGPQSVSADVVLKAQRKRIATLDSLLNCIRS